MKTDQLREHFDDPTRADRARHIDRQAFAREFIDDRQALQLLTIGTGVEDEVVSPNLPGCKRRLRPGARQRNAFPRTSPRHLESALLPRPPRAIDAHSMALTFEKDVDATIAITKRVQNFV